MWWRATMYHWIFGAHPHIECVLYKSNKLTTTKQHAHTRKDASFFENVKWSMVGRPIVKIMSHTQHSTEFAAKCNDFIFFSLVFIDSFLFYKRNSPNVRQQINIENENILHAQRTHVTRELHSDTVYFTIQYDYDWFHFITQFLYVVKF